MTAYVTALLQNLLQRSRTLSIGGPPAGVHLPLACNPADAAVTPMLYRSEAFADDLFDSHATH